MSPPKPQPQLNTDSWTVGAQLQLRTVLQEVVEGQVFAYDASANMLLLREAGSHNGVSNLRLINGLHVEATLKAVSPTGPVDLELPAVDEDRVKRREEKALKQAEMELHRVGVGVSKEAQAIFEALNKTLPCRWRDKTIVVLDEVLVPEPYTVSSCTSDGRTNPKALDRVKLIVRDARSRLGLGEELS